jgi:hypothetical protein
MRAELASPAEADLAKARGAPDLHPLIATYPNVSPAFSTRPRGPGAGRPRAMLLIPCPWCGPRDASEFTCGGEAHSYDSRRDFT